MAPSTDIQPIAEEPTVVAARVEYERTAKIEADLIALIDAGDREDADAVRKLEADAARPQRVVAVKLSHARTLQARAAYDRAREMAKVELHARFHERKRVLVAKVHRRLSELVPDMSALSALEVEEHGATGDYLDPAAWAALLPSDAFRESFLDTWTVAMRARGLLD
jgi:hypothetical protein